MTIFNPVSLAIKITPKPRGEGFNIDLKDPDGSTIREELELTALKAKLGELQALCVSHKPEEYGRILFKALFPGQLLLSYGQALGANKQRGIRLSLELDEGSPELWSIPWERLYQPQGTNWTPICTDSEVVFSRYLSTGNPWGVPLVAGKLRVLIVIASPYPQGHKNYVDVSIEKENITRVLDKHPEQIHYEILSRPANGAVDAKAIQAELSKDDGYDILHYIGHGLWDKDEQKFCLVMEEWKDGNIGPVGIPTEDFIQQLAIVPHGPALIVLSACNSAMPQTADAFMGLGPELVKAGCPAVVCMQEEIQVNAAHLFSQDFYEHLLDHGVVDLAVGQARVPLYKNEDWQWALPVLFMRLEDGVLFNPEKRFLPTERKPYKSVKSFKAEDQDLFTGRVEEVKRICENIQEASPITVVFGEPGVGLTSIMEAGVRPVLEKEGGLVVSLSEYSNMVSEFYRQLQNDGHPIHLQVSADSGLPDVLQALTSQPFQYFVLVLDQFERALDLPVEDLARIINDIVDGLKKLRQQLRVVLVLHSDHCDRLAAQQEVLKIRQETWIPINPLDKGNALTAIIKPLEILRYPVTLNPKLAEDQIVIDLDHLYRYRGQLNSNEIMVDPGQLQITCSWLYERAYQGSHQIDDDLYARQGGGAEGIMARYMADELHTHFADQIELTRQVLIAMAAPNHERWIEPDQLKLKEVDMKLVRSILDRLVKAELLIRREQVDRSFYAFSTQKIADEARALGGEETEKLYQVEDEMERAWRLWLVNLAHRQDDPNAPDRALPTIEQMNYFSELHEQVQPLPSLDRMLMLLRASIVRDRSPQPWLEWLAKSDKLSLLTSLDKANWDEAQRASPDPVVERLKYLLDIIDLQPDNNAQESSSGPGLIAWAAAHAEDFATSQTAALILPVIHPDSILACKKLEAALASIPSNPRRARRRAALFGSLEDANMLPPEYIHKISIFDRASIYFWRFKRRIRRDERRIRYMLLGGLLGSGLGLGLLHMLIAMAYQLRPGGDHFFRLARNFLMVYSYNGMFMGLITIGGIALSAALLPNESGYDPSPVHPDRMQARLGVLLGTLGFGCGNLILAWLVGLTFSKAPLVVPLGFAAGAGLCLALMGHPEDTKQVNKGKWARLAIGVGLWFTALQSIFIAVPDKGTGLPFVLDWGFYWSDFGEFAFNWWRSITQSFPFWPKFLSLLDAFSSGAVLFLGLAIGLRWAARKLSERSSSSDSA